MPSSSRKQHNLMEGAAHDPDFARRVGVPRDVARDFVHADERDKNYKRRDHVAKADANQSPGQGPTQAQAKAINGLSPEMHALLRKA